MSTNRRDFVKMAAAFPAAAVSVSLLVKEDGKEPIEADVSVLKCQPGDVLVLKCCSGYITQDNAERLKASVEHNFPGLKGMVLGDGLSVEGVIRVKP